MQLLGEKESTSRLAPSSSLAFAWDDHIDTIVKRASRKLYILYSLKNVVGKKELIILHKSLIESIINYCSCSFIYLPHHLERKLLNLIKDVITSFVIKLVKMHVFILHHTSELPLPLIFLSSHHKTNSMPSNNTSILPAILKDKQKKTGLYPNNNRNCK